MDIRTGEHLDNLVQWNSNVINGALFSLGHYIEDRLQAAVTYYNFNVTSIYASIYIPVRLHKEFLHKILDFPFNELNVTYLVATTYSSNKKSINFLEKLGFEKNATIPRIGFEESDLLYYVLTKDKINGRYCK